MGHQVERPLELGEDTVTPVLMITPLPLHHQLQLVDAMGLEVVQLEMPLDTVVMEVRVLVD